MVEKSNPNPSADLLALVAKAKQIGSDTMPAGTSELEEKILAIFDQSGKILTAKQVHSIIREKDTKYYSDKLWYLSRPDANGNKKLNKCKTRGYYQSVKVTPAN